MLRLTIVFVALACSAAGAFGQEKMLANYDAMPDLRCAGGFLEADGFWTAEENASLEREKRWVRISAIHDILPVAGVRAGADEPGYRVNTKHEGGAVQGGARLLRRSGAAAQYKVHLLQAPEVFLEFLARCQRDRGVHSLLRRAAETGP